MGGTLRGVMRLAGRSMLWPATGGRVASRWVSAVRRLSAGRAAPRETRPARKGTRNRGLSGAYISG